MNIICKIFGHKMIWHNAGFPFTRHGKYVSQCKNCKMILDFANGDDELKPYTVKAGKK